MLFCNSNACADKTASPGYMSFFCSHQTSLPEVQFAASTIHTARRLCARNGVCCYRGEHSRLDQFEFARGRCCVISDTLTSSFAFRPRHTPIPPLHLLFSTLYVASVGVRFIAANFALFYLVCFTFSQPTRHICHGSSLPPPPHTCREIGIVIQPQWAVPSEVF